MEVIVIPQATENTEDILEAHRAGRPIRPHGPYRIQVGDDALDFQPRVIAEPTPTGDQILDAAGITDDVNYVAYKVLTSGLLEELRPDEKTDLRHSGVERFIIFRTDRSFRFFLNGRAFDWGAPRITGLTLKKLAGVNLEENDVWLEFTGANERRIGDQDFVDLAAPGVERFHTRAKVYEVFVNTRPRQVRTSTLTFWQVVKLAYPEAVDNGTTYYTVTYKHGPASNPHGNMVAGEIVHVKDGMRFNVTPTDKS
jgi:Multiubiquitin